MSLGPKQPELRAEGRSGHCARRPRASVMQSGSFEAHRGNAASSDSFHFVVV